MMGNFYQKKDYKIKKKLIGIFGLSFLVIFAIELALRVDGYQPFVWTGSFMSIPSFLVVVAFSGLTYAKKDKYEVYELGAVLKQDIILGGWIGTIIGVILMFNFANNDIIANFGVLLRGLAAAMVTLIYGYMMGNVVECCWPKETV